MEAGIKGSGAKDFSEAKEHIWSRLRKEPKNIKESSRTTKNTEKEENDGI